MNSNFLLILQIIIGLVLSIFILIQSKGTGFGQSWAASSSFTRRGLEQLIFRSTFALGGFFLVISILSVIK